MEISEAELAESEQRMERLRAAGYAIAARYDARRGRVIVMLNTGLEVNFPADRAEGLANAPAESLKDIEISPAGLGLHWPRLGADLYLPALLQGVLGSQRWMARQLGAQGGSARSELKATAARANGKKGGRPRKVRVVDGLISSPGN